MITRIWHGRTRVSDAESYLKFLLEKGVADYVKTPGNLEVRVWRSIEQDAAHFWTVSVWDNMSSVEAFAGKEVNKAVYYEEDHQFLLEFEPTVRHMETFYVK